MAITPTQVSSAIETIDSIEKAIDAILTTSAPGADGTLTFRAPAGFRYENHFNQIRALYLHAGWKDVIYNNESLKFLL